MNPCRYFSVGMHSGVESYVTVQLSKKMINCFSKRLHTFPWWLRQ